MELLKEKHLLNQMSILLPGKMDEIKRHTTSYWERKAAAEVKRENRKANAMFALMVILIFGFIGFSIWLSVAVGINKKSLWDGGQGTFILFCSFLINTLIFVYLFS
jgi:hypothetical protein